jgi:hypothetical protein
MKKRGRGRPLSFRARVKQYGLRRHVIPKDAFIVNDIPHDARPVWGTDTGHLGMPGDNR